MNYIHLTEENENIQYEQAERVLVLIQYLGSLTFVFSNEALLHEAVGMESSWPFSIAIVLLGICFVTPIYHLFWAATLKK
ncbi:MULTISPECIES: hypothetical protein [Bacillaceae]|uniref:hypothetical protein n=1 Tax=Bacillaceae TaxID=186817 RepID=UPI00214C74E5|nr:hypothetical protein [Rossellomorea sp. YZS02]MDX8342551.1 hypothetical protein [Rossellomorea sp. YZS02]